MRPAAFPAAPFVLLDDARRGGAPARLYSRPRHVFEAWAPDEVAPLIERVRASGAAAAGFLSYAAGAAFEPAAPLPRDGGVPLAWFAVFDQVDEVDDVAALLPDAAAAWVGAPVPQASRKQYERMFAQTQALITAGDLYQLNLTFRADVPIAGDPLALYARLRGAALAGWGGVVATGRETLLSFSPELFFALAADGTLTCRPMKGTARREDDPAADALAARRLADDAKQRAENLMIVDLMRNDLARVAAAGSVQVPELYAVESYPTVHQMTSTVTATLDADRTVADVIAALFPCGSITGAPKVRAMQAIDAIEQGAPRGAYTGAIGRIDADGSAMFNVAIRTLTIAPGGEHATIGLGGGIVAESNADDEWEEALAKGAFLTSEARRADLIETMAFDPMEGLLRIEAHLARMKASAAALGFCFDRHATRNELQAATFRLRSAARVRLVLSRSGSIAIEVLPPVAPTTAPMRVALAPLPTVPGDWRLRHKSSDRGFYDAARVAAGTDEVVFVDPAGLVTEGSFTNVFVPRGDGLVTPPAGPLLPGVLRGELLAQGRATEARVTADDLAGGFLIGNAVRGLMPATLAVAK